MSAFPLEADIPPCPSDVGFGPTADMATGCRPFDTTGCAIAPRMSLSSVGDRVRQRQTLVGMGIPLAACQWPFAGFRAHMRSAKARLHDPAPILARTDDVIE